jgi:protein-disulfide isomerase
MVLRAGRWTSRNRIVAVALAAMAGTAYAGWLHGLVPRQELPVPDGPRVEIPTEGLPHKGAPVDRSRVTMIECSDFQCPYSRRASATVDELIASNDDLAFFHVHLPLGLFEHSRLKARAAVAAQRQGEDRFWSMHDALFERVIESEDDAVALAAELGLDTDRFARDLKDPATAGEVDRQRNLCRDANVRAVPTFFINGRRVVGSVPARDFQRVIDQERDASAGD